MPDENLETRFPLLTSEDLTEEEKQQYRALFYRSAVTRSMLVEIRYLKQNARTVADLAPPADIPMYFFTSDDQETEAPGWKDALTDYLSTMDKGRHVHLSTGPL